MKITQSGFALVMLLTITMTPANALSDDMKMPRVGDCYGGGVVFYVNPNQQAPAGQRGLIAAITDAPATKPSQLYAWDTTGNTCVGTVTAGKCHTTTKRNYFAGAPNTQKILNTKTVGQWPAATAAATYNGGGAKDWYLPSQNESATLYFQSVNMGTFGRRCGFLPFSLNDYWTSTQGVNGYAWHVDFAVGHVFGTTTITPLRVRPIRAF